MRKHVFLSAFLAVCVWCGLDTAHAQLKSKTNFTLEQELRIEALTDEYVKQGLDVKQARMKAEKEVAPAVVELRISESGLSSSMDHDDWMATTPAAGSIHVDRDADIHAYTPSELVKKILLHSHTPSDEARIQNVTFKGWGGVSSGGNAWNETNTYTNQYGVGNRGLAYFTKGDSNFDIEKGLLLSSGHTWGHEGPNQMTNAFSQGVGADGVSAGSYSTYSSSGINQLNDPDLNTIAYPPPSPHQVSRGSILQFDFQPAISSVSFDYVFGCEEYPEYVHSTFNDVFGFFVTGPYDSPGGGSSPVTLPSLPGKKEKTPYNGSEIAAYNRFNIAQLPNGMPVGVDWVNWGYRNSNTAASWAIPADPGWNTPWDTTGVGAYLFTNNLVNLHATSDPVRKWAFNPQYYRAVYDGDAMMELDGLTIKLTAKADSLIPGKWYHLKLGISQVDQAHGEGVFLADLDLGSPEAGIESNVAKYNWPEANDELGKDQWYAGCPQTLKLKFLPDASNPRTVKLTYIGLTKNYIVGTDGKAIPSEYTLAKNDTVIRIDFMTLTVPDALEGQTGAIVSTIVGGGLDTTDFFTFYNRPTYSVNYVPPTTMFAGKLDLNLKGGSPHLFRSINGGITWENAWTPLTVTQIANFGYKGQIILKEPHSCCDFVIPIEKYEGLATIPRPVNIPFLSDADIYPPSGIHFIDSRKDFTVVIRPTGANAGLIPVLTTNRTAIPDSEGVELKGVENGVYTFVIHYVQEDIKLNVNFISPSATTDADGTEIWGGNGQVHLSSSQAGEVKIYGVSGRQVQAFTLPSAGSSSIALPAGIYVVSLNGKAYRVAVR
ncbi:MAG: T9SS type A sorting domain-containing protein [Tannerella sp.]|jgi:hypothetical protein|nr:T9SS type A sorting domain-containing protein [Tannerella sp.]